MCISLGTSGVAENTGVRIESGLPKWRRYVPIFTQSLALPFLPYEHIEAAFVELRIRTNNEQINRLLDYVEHTWINSNVWPVVSWSVFRRSIRTNNDVEAWHHRINARASRQHVPFYFLINFLFEEARLVNIHVCLVSERKLCRYQRRQYRRIQGALFGYWDEYEAGTRSVSQLLRACGSVYGYNGV